MCGADVIFTRGALRERGSSPRVRSRHRGEALHIKRARIISACAEQTGSVPAAA